MTAEDLRQRVRATESKALWSGLGNTALALPWSAAIIGLIFFAPEPLYNGFPEVPLSTWHQLVLFPAVPCGFGLWSRVSEGVQDWYAWYSAHRVRRNVDRHPDRAALLVPPLETHLNELRAIRGHRQVALRRVLWIVFPIGLIIAVLVFGVQVEDPDGTLRDAPEAVVPTIAVLVALSLIIIAVALPRWRRWYAAYTAEKWSGDPAYAAALSHLGPDPQQVRASDIPPLRVQFVNPKSVDYRLTVVSSARNVFKSPPLKIAYLRLFENQARVRNFLHGAWREFGYVYILRSSGSVSPAEIARARADNAIRTMFATSPRTFRTALAGFESDPLPPGKHRLTGITNMPERVDDPAGSYPVRALLCHGSFWKNAVDLLLARVDLVAVDLSGYVPANTGTQFELQRVIDRFPINRAVLLCDAGSDRAFIEAQVRYHWSQMASGSPNAGTVERTILVAVTGAGRPADRELMTRLLERRRRTS
ncbi:hypothetical protein [Nocardia vinacea]|uniref:hypothetical protein n=1 Tax=Nocardia vinacea TaxID=96468 RepID=UPI0002DECA9A|nr:hypothetical protein [Nocardia vinacea]